MDDRALSFGPFLLLPARRLLIDSGRPVRIGNRAFDLLAALVERAGQVVSKEELIARVWPNLYVQEGNLKIQVSALRRALGDGQAGQRYITNVAGRGYEFVAPVAVDAEPPMGEFPLETTTSRNNLPATVARLVGREGDIAMIAPRLLRTRLLTLIGPGGVGKTSVALAVAEAVTSRFEHGAWFVDLAPLIEERLVPSAVAAALNLQILSEDALPGIVEHLKDKQMLLVLDNCEHVIDMVAQLAETFLQRTEGIMVLATSREPLRIAGEHVYRVSPLAVPRADAAEDILARSAVQLFIERSKALDSDYLPTSDQLPLIAHICRRLDGIPLAIEFAASQSAALGLQALSESLQHHRSHLGGGRRTAPSRHQTLRALLDWSFDLLTEEERELLRCLAIFRSSFTLDAAVAVCRGGSARHDVLDRIAALFDKSLITSDGLETTPRWRLLETTRSYALARLAESGQMDDVARRHASWLRDLVLAAVPDFSSALAAETSSLFADEIHNVRAALDWAFSPAGDAIIGIELTAAYAPFWMQFSRMMECHERCQSAIDLIAAGAHVDKRLQVRLLLYLGNTMIHASGRFVEAETALFQALEIASRLKDLSAQTVALFFLHGLYWYRGRYRQMAAVTERLKEIAQQLNNPIIVSVIDRHVGDSLASAGAFREARQHLTRVAHVTEQEGQQGPFWRRPLADRLKASAMLARVLWLQGFADQAKDEALAALEQVPSTDQLTTCLVLYFGICKIAPMTGDFATGEEATERLTKAATRMNSGLWMTVAQFCKGKLLVERGGYADGAAALRAAFAHALDYGWRPSYPEFRGSLALALLRLGRHDEAEAAIGDAITAASQIGPDQHWYMPELLRIKAEIFLGQSAHSPDAAADCLTYACSMARRQGALAWELRSALSLARLRLSQERGADAKRCLTPVLSAFSEGFETADLKEARETLALL